ncbi:ABC transporter substrate-binding protein [Haloarchaeobius salinus]|uniref:ABC transporter substrate-binding protein n=1 Tax=Haloarchaeobius salinus TaxID=1198298 RepID=UPI002108D2CB|nr:ABC transporter substrate-binding protein [Haloarchaeobius salinus]
MAQDDTFADRLRRRRFLRLGGAAGVAGLAGCLNQGELQGETDDSGDDTEDGGGGGGDETDDGGGGGGGSGEPITVGAAIPFSGDLSDFGEPMLNAMQMAVEDINAAGGPLGREIEVNDEDTGTDSTQGVNAANKLVETDGVDAVLGAVSSGVTISIAQSVTIPNGVLHLNSASSSPSISTLDDDDLLFRTRTNDRFVARVMARIIENEGADSAAVVYVNNDFGQALADTFESTFSGTTTAAVGFSSGQSSYEQVLSEAFSDDPDMIAFAGYPESGTTMLSQWNEGGYGGNWVLHTSMLSEDVISNVGAEVLNGMFGVRTRPPTGDATESFVGDYESEYPDADVFSPYSWNSYDSLVSYALAVHAAGSTDSDAVKAEMRTVSNPPGDAVSYGEFGDGVDLLDDGTEIDYSGPSGTVDFDDNGDVASDMVVVEVVDGEFEDQEVIPADELV